MKLFGFPIDKAIDGNTIIHQNNQQPFIHLINNQVWFGLIIQKDENSLPTVTNGIVFGDFKNQLKKSIEQIILDYVSNDDYSLCLVKEQDIELKYQILKNIVQNKLKVHYL